MNRLPPAAKAFIALIVLTGAAVLLYGLVHLRPAAPLQFLAYLALAVAASRLRVKLPGVHGIMSVTLPFSLIAAVKLSISEALVIACVSSLAQSLARRGRNKPVQIVFNTAALTNAVGLAALAFTAASQHQFVLPAAIIAAGATYFLGNTVPMTLVLWLAEGARPVLSWARMVELTVPYYLLSASIAATVCGGLKNIGWTIALVVFAAMYLTYRSYRAYFAPPAAEPRSAAKAAAD